MSRIIFILALLLHSFSATSREFTVLVYNVENLFDADGIAEYSDYQVAPFNSSNPYTPKRFLTKMQNIAEVVSQVNEGNGPEVILFQEFELDRTPFNGGKGDEEVLAEYKEKSVEELLTDGFSAEVANISSIQFLLKVFSEYGMDGYSAVTIDPFETNNHTAHANVIFTRFPVLRTWQRALESARDLQGVKLDIDGYGLYLLNNHWKSGASNRDTAAARRLNAMVVKEELDRILEEDASADVIIGGDLNSYYNQSAVFPDWGQVGINDFLGSETDEVGLVEGTGPILYNLWGELPLEERGSEVYRGKWGTLMQMMLTRGLYDKNGVQYVDNSFFRLAVPGLNIDPVWGQPISWSNIANGHGFSDHLPIGARFRIVGAGSKETFTSLKSGTRERRIPNHQPVVDYSSISEEPFPSAEILQELSEEQRVDKLGELFLVEGDIPNRNRRGIVVGGEFYGLYLPKGDIRAAIEKLGEGAPIRFVGEFGVFRGKEQFIVQDISWLR
ncbi:hypothetical protein MLD52_03925 [Puniceicoccaceae bacterium K14]|nr:hypothetical protein [Puniceicoccaceae bacterium K14]